MIPCCLVVDTDISEKLAASLLISIVKTEAEISAKLLYLPTDLRFVSSQKSVWLLHEFKSASRVLFTL